MLADPRVIETRGLDPETRQPAEEPFSVAMARNLPLLRLSVAPKLFHEQNAGPWLYYLSLALPVVVLIVLAADRLRGVVRPYMSHERAKMFVAAMMIGLANFALFRKVGYLADHADVAAIFGAWFIGRVVGPGHVTSRSGSSGGEPGPPGWRWPHVVRATRAVVVGGILAVTLVATAAYVHPLRLLETTGITGGFGVAYDYAARAFDAYATSPPIDAYAPTGVGGDRGLLRYAYDCTQPDDRIWVLSDVYTLPYYTERRVVRHIYWSMGFQNSLEIQRRTIALLEAEPVPLIVGVGGRRPLEYLESYELLHDYVSRRYVDYFPIIEDNLSRGQVLWVLVDSERRSSGIHEPLKLPCFS